MMCCWCVSRNLKGRIWSQKGPILGSFWKLLTRFRLLKSFIVFWLQHFNRSLQFFLRRSWRKNLQIGLVLPLYGHFLTLEIPRLLIRFPFLGVFVNTFRRNFPHILISVFYHTRIVIHGHKRGIWISAHSIRVSHWLIQTRLIIIWDCSISGCYSILFLCTSPLTASIRVQFLDEIVTV